jgi:hypothetical protein
MKMMKMRVKKYFLPFFLPFIAVLCFVFLSPAFAGMKKVDEAELSRTNASVTGASVKDQSVGVEKGMVIPEKCQACENSDKNGAVFSPSVGKNDSAVVDMNVNGQFRFYRGDTNAIMTGHITTLTTH